MPYFRKSVTVANFLTKIENSLWRGPSGISYYWLQGAIYFAINLTMLREKLACKMADCQIWAPFQNTFESSRGVRTCPFRWCPVIRRSSGFSCRPQWYRRRCWTAFLSVQISCWRPLNKAKWQRCFHRSLLGWRACHSADSKWSISRHFRSSTSPSYPIRCRQSSGQIWPKNMPHDLRYFNFNRQLSGYMQLLKTASWLAQKFPWFTTREARDAVCGLWLVKRAAYLW